MKSLNNRINEAFNESSSDNMITISNPKQLSSKAVEDKITALIKKGVKTSDIKLTMEFLGSDMMVKEIMADFQKIKNRIAMDNDTRYDSVNEKKISVDIVQIKSLKDEDEVDDLMHDLMRYNEAFIICDKKGNKMYYQVINFGSSDAYTFSSDTLGEISDEYQPALKKIENTFN